MVVKGVYHRDYIGCMVKHFRNKLHVHSWVAEGFMDQQRSTAVRADGHSIVTKANALIEASYNLTLNEQRIILACAAKLDGRKPMPREAVFVGLYVIPVYPFCAFVDLFVINSIEFWSGENPISGEPALTEADSVD